MPIGTYKYKPNNPNKIQLSDCQELILALLKDVATESPKTLLNTCKVSESNDFNLADLNKETATYDLLLSFMHNQADPRNTDLNANYNDDGDQVQIVYSIMAIVQRDNVTSDDFRKAFEEIIVGISDNYNSITSTPLPYTATLANGKILSTSLKNNPRDTFQEGFIDREDTQQPNYLTASINVVFTIINNT